ncbi:MAG: ATP-binding cassette domain-containing protein [Chlamydiales bacterium]|nr:ABC transporter ATP-binding protein [Chlamydiales bacterium]NCF70346.1 ATP-binding cassette domain-containing protein [Chlamydiales bacterium]
MSKASSSQNELQYALEARNIYKTFKNPSKVQVLNDVSVSLEKGKAMCIMGASGEGKSTILHILGTLDQADKGSIFICGEKVERANECSLRNEKIGFVFQSFHLLEDYTALENVLMPAMIGRKSVAKSSSNYKRALELLDYVGLSSRVNFRSKLLSGGEKQRVALARALCNDPEIILADEPTGNLDHQTSLKVQKILLESTVGRGKSLLVVTHDPELAQLCDEVYTLQEGKLRLQKS